MEQRVIKFRAWDKKYEEMLYSYESEAAFFMTSDGMKVQRIRHAPEGEEDFFKTENESDFVIMQFIGLSDKHGNKIYSGDVVKSGNDIMRVVWYEKFACYCLTQSKWMYPHFFGEAADPDECEVIGNIFQNPELL